MESALIRDTFIPKFGLIQGDKLIFLKESSHYIILEKNIEREVTHGLGYEPIRPPEKRIRSMKGLKRHLANMEAKSMLSHTELYRLSNLSLIPYINYLEKYVGELTKLLDYKKLSSQLDFIQNAIVEKDAHILELEEKLRKVEKRRGIFSRITS